MCGILAIYSKKIATDERVGYFKDMLSLLSSRGPDRMVHNEIGPLNLGHTRLSIIDLETGDQPIYNETGTVAVVLNGEIYNYLELKEKLRSKGHVFKTNSDTETVVHLYEEYGEAVFEKLNGMFAIIIYDKEKDVLLAARDRLGEKPLIYSVTNDYLLITSELKTASKFPLFKHQIDVESVYLYFNSLYIPAPKTIYKGIFKLMPSHYLKFDKSGLALNRYYQPKFQIKWDMKEQDICQEFNELLNKVVSERMLSDVPLGAFLSGGIDSSSVVAAMARTKHDRINTYTVGLHGHFDEREFAREVSKRFGTSHNEIVVKADIHDAFIDVMSYFDEPFADASAIPTYLISKEARKFVKVILSGDGGDELFAGYSSYIWQKYLRKNKYSSSLYRRINQQLIKYLKYGSLDNFLYIKDNYHTAFKNWRKTRSYYMKNEIDTMLNEPSYNFDIDDFYQHNRWLKISNHDSLNVAFCMDLNNYLPDDLLKKVDMASMMCGLETRSPYLDYRMLEFAMSIPPHNKLKNDITKYIPKSALREILPERILSRGKYGFGAPTTLWMRNQLKELTLDLLSNGCKSEQFIKREAIDRAIRPILKSEKEPAFGDSSKLWMILVFEWWLRTYELSQG